MSLNFSLLFGNIDSEGKLDNEDLDDSLRDTFQNVDQNALSHLLGSSLNFDDDENKAESSSEDVNSTEEIKHDSNAIDYSDFNELVDDDTQSSKIKIEPNINNNNNNISNSNSKYLNAFIGGKVTSSVTPKFHSSLYKSSVMDEDEDDYDEIEKKEEIKEEKKVEVKKEEKEESITNGN